MSHHLFETLDQDETVVEIKQEQAASEPLIVPIHLSVEFTDGTNMPIDEYVARQLIAIEALVSKARNETANDASTLRRALRAIRKRTEDAEHALCVMCQKEYGETP
jgi:hypothetical protein